ncbi:MAG: rhodanese-related sulfurtransferase [Anaerolineae bacterium]|nr:rhodanese-related sulfurtransferase [Anaerolineae bacterium]
MWNIPEITPQELAKRQQKGKGPYLLDVREPEEWAIVHIDGAVLAPITVLAEQGVSALPQDLQPETEVVVYCHHGTRSGQVTAWLRRNGYANAKNLSGGIDEYALVVEPPLARY